MNNLENIKQYNTSRIDITRYMFSDDFTLGNYLNDEMVVVLISLGVPCGAIQAVYKGRDVSHREEHEMSDDELARIRQVYVPINTLDELARHRATHFCSYTINPNYIEPKKVQRFIYRLELLTDKYMGMFNIDDINKHQIELLNNVPLTYTKLENMKNKYITPELEREFIEKHKQNGLTEERFYELLNADACKGIGNIYLDELDKMENEEEFE